MALNTIEQALVSMAATLHSEVICREARDAIEQGATFEATLLIKPGKDGASITLSTRAVTPAISHGRLIRLK